MKALPASASSDSASEVVSSDSDEGGSGESGYLKELPRLSLDGQGS